VLVSFAAKLDTAPLLALDERLEDLRAMDENLRLPTDTTSCRYVVWSQDPTSIAAAEIPFAYGGMF
jgi:hypothetical protein